MSYLSTQKRTDWYDYAIPINKLAASKDMKQQLTLIENMRQQLTSIFTIILLLAGLTNMKAQGLTQTIKKFTKVITQTQATQTDFIQNLKPLIDPSSNVDSLCIDYYRHWKYNSDHNSYPIKTKIENVDKYSKDSVTVKISNIWHWSTNEKYFFLSETTWVKKDKKWYRTGVPAKIIEKRIINQ